MMYYILTYIPTFIQIIIFSLHRHVGIVFRTEAQILYVVFLLFVTPLYLLIVNRCFLIKDCISYSKSMSVMLSVILSNTAVFMIDNKIESGYFIGDVPEGIYYLMIGIPTVITVFGIVLIRFLRK